MEGGTGEVFLDCLFLKYTLGLDICVHQFYSHFIGQNSVMWCHSTARETGKRSLALCLGEKGTGSFPQHTLFPGAGFM